MDQPEPQQKRRNPWLAGIGNLVDAPLGHVYAGQAWRGVLMHAAMNAISLLAITAVAGTVGRVGLLLTAFIIAAAKVFRIADAILVARQQGSQYRLKWYNRWHVYLLTLAVGLGTNHVIVGAFRTNVAEAFYLPSGAMVPTLQIGDRILVDKRVYRRKSPERFDVVVFRAPRRGINGVTVSLDENVFIKRVVGLPGDTVEVVPDTVMVDGKPAVQLIDRVHSSPYSTFLDAEQRGLFIDKEHAPQAMGGKLVLIDEPRVVVTPSGEARYRDGQLCVEGQAITSIGERGLLRSSNDLTPYGASPKVEGVAYFIQDQDQPKLIVLKGYQLTLRPGHVKLNGSPLKEPYIKESIRYAMPPYIVPAGYYFVLGDNRNDSNDSHGWGPLAGDRIFGVARMIFWSLDEGSGVRRERIGRPLTGAAK